MLTTAMGDWPSKPTDLRRNRRQSERRLVISIILIFVVVGGALIGVIYGWEAVFTGLLCLLPGAGALVVLWLLLRILERLSDRW
jgi:hypothetical protein